MAVLAGALLGAGTGLLSSIFSAPDRAADRKIRIQEILASPYLGRDATTKVAPSNLAANIGQGVGSGLSIAQKYFGKKDDSGDREPASDQVASGLADIGLDLGNFTNEMSALINAKGQKKRDIASASGKKLASIAPALRDYADQMGGVIKNRGLVRRGEHGRQGQPPGRLAPYEELI